MSSYYGKAKKKNLLATQTKYDYTNVAQVLFWATILYDLSYICLVRWSNIVLERKRASNVEEHSGADKKFWFDAQTQKKKIFDYERLHQNKKGNNFMLKLKYLLNNEPNMSHSDRQTRKF